MVELPAVSLEELLERAELLGIARCEADLLAGPRVQAIVEGQFQHFGQVEVAGEDIGFFAERADLHATAGAAVACVGHGFAHTDQLLDDQVAVEDGRLAEAGADDPGRSFDEPVRILLGHLDRGTRLHEPHLLDHIQDQVGHVVDAVGAVLLHAAGVDLGEVGVRAALGGRDPNLGRGRLVVEFHPQALEQLLRLLAGQCPLIQALFVEQIQVLVKPAGAEGVPGIHLGRDAQMNEPVVLQGFPEVPRRMGRDVRTNLGDSFELGSSLGIGFLRGQVPGLLGVTLGETDQSVRTDQHGFELFLFGVHLRIIQVVEAVQTALDVSLEVEHALAIDLVVQHGVTGGSLLHELGEHAGLVRRQPALVHGPEYFLPHGLAGPERDNRLAVHPADLLRDGERDLLAVVEDLQVLQAVAA